MSIAIQTKRPVHLFEGYGVEMEYMIVDAESLDILPITDKVLQQEAGKIVNEISRNGMAWSNELVLHVIEIKTDGPAQSLENLGSSFQQQISDIEHLLKPFNARLLPGAIHPWMDPFQEVQLWPHDYNPIYEAYNRIFDCRGHGWGNLQSTHLNLPFEGDEEFEKLHAAVRILLPLIPALAASSPVADSLQKDFLDFRMEMYRLNSIRIPSITGLIVPEPVFSKQEYQTQIFDRMYRDISPYDPDGILQDEWLNSRGAMSRWDRNTIEIRVIDIQEYPGADIAILEYIVALAKSLISEKWCSLETQKSWSDKDLYPILMSLIKDGERAIINNKEYISLFGVQKSEISAGELCSKIFGKLQTEHRFQEESSACLNTIFDRGPLGRRILKALPESFTHRDLHELYHQLSNCLKDGKLFLS